jgi:hypothetical protein
MNGIVAWPSDGLLRIGFVEIWWRIVVFRTVLSL